MIKAIILTCGFAEDQQLGFVPFVSTEGFFKSKTLAFKCLADTFLAMYQDTSSANKRERQECCSKYIENIKFIYCPECSTVLQCREEVIDWESLSYYISDICMGKLAQSQLSALEEYGWTTSVSFSDIHSLKKSEVAIIEESADGVLAKLALGIKDGEEES